MADKKKGLSRRDFIVKSVAGAGVLAVGLTPLKLLSNQAKAAGAGHSAPGHSAPAQAPRAGHQWCMVIDLKKCDGCVTIDAPPQCTQACTAMHFIPKGQQWIQVFNMEMPGGGNFFMPAPCNQCENAPCVNVCPVAATYQTPEGITLIDENRCIGCRMCLAACPYQRRFFNWGEPEVPPEAAAIPYTPEFPVGGIKGTAAKCTFCIHLLREDKAPACITGCPMKALYMGDLTEDVASNGRDVVQLSRFLDENNAFRFKEELGTQPRVFYLPGHGEEFQRHANDPRTLKTPVWTWGGDGFEKPISLWPWGEK